MVAHELAHVRNRDIVVQTPVVMISAALIDASRLGGWLERALLYVFGPLAAALQHILLSPKREYAADRFAAEICDTPHGLADALLRLDQAAELVEFRASPAAEPLFTIDPIRGDRARDDVSSHPPVAERVRRLRELGPGQRKRGRRVGGPVKIIRRRPTLPGAFAPSTIGAGGLNCSVRNGKRCIPAAMTTGSCESIGA